ncbi:TetR/AcrR family transcriptional regulator [Tomitella biformata]|uniref:TetR/AcrR family transcriptional regulator n=1 Tax=Tomitella biformata TaxID=630403 RepID=UPI000467CD12|nr:TetR/AcrR family transcriptional regulator [Tomitella biformata]
MNPKDRRRQILDCSAELFAHKGIGATTVREIAVAVGVHSGALYHYFPSKEAIVTELIREYVVDLTSRGRAVMAQGLAPVPRLEALILAALTCSADYRAATTVWQREATYMRERVVEASLDATADELEEDFRATIAEALADGSLRTDISADLFYRLLRDAIWLAPNWHQDSPGYSTESLARDIVGVFVDGFRTRG